MLQEQSSMLHSRERWGATLCGFSVMRIDIQVFIQDKNIHALPCFFFSIYEFKSMKENLI